MTIIKIEQNENGSHDNQTINGVTPETFPIPEGYAVVKEDLGTPDTLKNYPFGAVTVETKYRYSVNIGGQTKSVELNERTDKKGMDETTIQYVTSWTPLPKPKPEPLPEPDPSDEPVTWSALAASIREGVNEV